MKRASCGSEVVMSFNVSCAKVIFPSRQDRQLQEPEVPLQNVVTGLCREGLIHESIDSWYWQVFGLGGSLSIKQHLG